MKYKLKHLIVLIVYCLTFIASCSEKQSKIDRLSVYHESFRGITWGEDFSEISKKVVLTRTKFGGNDLEPGYEVTGEGFSEFNKVPVVIFFQFVNNKLNIVHIYASINNKDKLISAVEELLGGPLASPSRNTAVWQDNITSLTLQKTVMDGGCLLSLANNANYMYQTGRVMRCY